MFHTTVWHPDTCDCIVEYSWDTDTDEDHRVHTFHAVHKQCEYHKHLDHKTTYNTLMEENPRKNIMLGTIAQLHPELKVSGHDGLRAQEAIWSFDEKRALHITCKSLSDDHKKVLQQRADLDHGAGKVIIH